MTINSKSSTKADFSSTKRQGEGSREPSDVTQVDILILSNGPGEVTTWVRPVVKALRQELGNDRSLVRIFALGQNI
jgi:outer membrane PBP1 activator LpoA protein